jgi:hypothetical protein
MSTPVQIATPPLTTPPTRLAIGKDGWHAREKMVDGIGNLNTAVSALQTLVGYTNDNSTAIDGNLSFGNISMGQPTGNLKTEMLTGTTPATANTAFTLTHTLGKIPNGALLIQSNVAAILYGDMTDQSWTTTTITLLCNQASVNYVILVL